MKNPHIIKTISHPVSSPHPNSQGCREHHMPRCDGYNHPALDNYIPGDISIHNSQFYSLMYMD